MGKKSVFGCNEQSVGSWVVRQARSNWEERMGDEMKQQKEENDQLVGGRLEIEFETRATLHNR